jgi:uroporphyrinogen decarboxylase
VLGRVFGRVAAERKACYSRPMLDVDLERFWSDNDLAQPDPFGAHIAQPPMADLVSYETIFSELGFPFDMRRLETDFAFARGAAHAYNDRAESIIGRRPLDELAYDPVRRPPAIKSIGELFGCARIWQSDSWWLMPCAHTTQELEGVLDRIEKLDLRSAMLPDDWDAQVRRYRDAVGHGPAFGHGLRGPVTLATSIYEAGELIFLIHDEPALASRFRDVLLRIILDYFTICDQISDPTGVTPGFGFNDDNCALLTPDMYAFFTLPILQAVFARFAPGAGDTRFQHSDSDMAHLLPLLAQAGLNAVNFGPNVRFAAIRAAMPRAVVQGTLAPFTLMRNDEQAIIAEVRRDLGESRSTRGLLVATAGSVNDGSKLTSVRAVMHAIQRYGAYC